MAGKKTAPITLADVVSDTPVTLHSQGLGINKAFTVAHAKAILARQEARGITNGWTTELPAETTPAAE